MRKELDEKKTAKNCNSPNAKNALLPEASFFLLLFRLTTSFLLLFRPHPNTTVPRASSAAAATAEASLDVTKMAPLGDRLLVRPRPAEEKSAGGVILSAGLSSGTTMPMQDALVGTVIAVGEEVALEGVAVGDAVLFSKYSSSDVSLPDGGEVCFVAEKSVLAKLS